jgi:AcrR family transcriptional regulator
MYRHFPDRRELIIAVYAGEVAALCARGEALLQDQSPDDALFAWLRAFIAHVAAKRELALAIPDDQGGQRSALFNRWVPRPGTPPSHGDLGASTLRVMSPAPAGGGFPGDYVFLMLHHQTPYPPRVFRLVSGAR